MIWPGCRLLFSHKSLPVPLFSVWKFSFQKKIFSETCPWIRQASWPIDILIIIDALLLLDIHIRMSSSGDVNVFLWNREWFFSRRVKFDSGFNVMAVYEVSWHGPKVIYRFTGIRKWVLRWWKWRPFWFFKKISLTFSSNWTLPYQARWMFSVPDLLQEILFVHLRLEKWIFHFLLEISPLLHWVFLSRFLMRPSFPTSSFQIPPRLERIQETIQVRLSFQIDDSRLVFRRNWVILNQRTKRNDWSIKRVSKNAFRMESSHQTINLWRFADRSTNFRDSQPSLRTLWSAVIKSPKFSLCARCTSASSARSPCDFGPLTDLAISVFREEWI